MTAKEIVDAGLYSTAVELMDEELREELHKQGAFEIDRPDTEERFLEAYIAAHEAKYGIRFCI